MGLIKIKNPSGFVHGRIFNLHKKGAEVFSSPLLTTLWRPAKLQKKTSGSFTATGPYGALKFW
jgi:hypothetical protein